MIDKQTVFLIVDDAPDNLQLLSELFRDEYSVLVARSGELALGDTMFCYSLLHNLIKNACEAASENSQVVVTLNDETPLRIIIRNKGAVAAVIRERFFDKFVTYGKPGGTGLGTYSEKLLTEAQNVAIMLAVSDREDRTTLSVTLPRYTEQTAPGTA